MMDFRLLSNAGSSEVKGMISNPMNLTPIFSQEAAILSKSVLIQD